MTKSDITVYSLYSLSFVLITIFCIYKSAVNFLKKKNEKVTDECCKQLLDVGRTCHDTFVQVSAPIFGNENETELFAKSNRVWNNCEVVSKN